MKVALRDDDTSYFTEPVTATFVGNTPRRLSVAAYASVCTAKRSTCWSIGRAMAPTR